MRRKFHDHVVDALGVLLLLQSDIVVWFWRNALGTTGLPGGVRLKIEVRFISFALSWSTTSNGLEIEINQVTRGAVFLSCVAVATTFTINIRFILIIYGN